MTVGIEWPLCRSPYKGTNVRLCHVSCMSIDIYFEKFGEGVINTVADPVVI